MADEETTVEETTDGEPVEQTEAEIEDEAWDSDDGDLPETGSSGIVAQPESDGEAASDGDDDSEADGDADLEPEADESGGSDDGADGGDVAGDDKGKKKDAPSALDQAKKYAEEEGDKENQELLKGLAEREKKRLAEEAAGKGDDEPEPKKAEKKADPEPTVDDGDILAEISEVKITSRDDDGEEIETTIGEFSKKVPEVQEIARMLSEKQSAKLEEKLTAKFDEKFEEVLANVTKNSEYIDSMASDRGRADLVAQIEADESLGHPDVAEIVASTDYQEWVAGIKDDWLIELGAKPDKKAAAIFLQVYKEEKGIETKAKAAPKKKSKAAKAKDDLHKVSSRTQRSNVTPSKTVEEEEEEAWDSDDGDMK